MTISRSPVNSLRRGYPGLLYESTRIFNRTGASMAFNGGSGTFDLIQAQAESTSVDPSGSEGSLWVNITPWAAWAVRSGLGVLNNSRRVSTEGLTAASSAGAIADNAEGEVWLAAPFLRTQIINVSVPDETDVTAGAPIVAVVGQGRYAVSSAPAAGSRIFGILKSTHDGDTSDGGAGVTQYCDIVFDGSGLFGSVAG